MEEADDTSLALRLGISQEIHSSSRAVTIRRSALDLTPFNTPKKPSSPGHSSISSFSTATYILKDDTDSRKKLRLTKQQSSLLEDSFKEHSTLTLKQKHVLANELNLRPRQVEVWFQNRRARTKLKQKEIDLEFLKRCFERLKEENLRLHKELNTLKFGPPPPPLCMQLPAAATLAMCPSCERNMAVVASASGFTTTAKPPHLLKSISPSRLHVRN